MFPWNAISPSNLIKMHTLNKEFNFLPRTWVLPADYGSLAFYMRDCKRKQIRKTLIVKPHNGARGRGIRLIHSLDNGLHKEPVIVQEYIDEPLLIDTFKCDLRVYVLVTSCDPLSILVYRDGLDLIVKTLIVAHPSLSHTYRACRPSTVSGTTTSQCFEILGFDILLDRTLKPWLLEVNRSPSFSTDTKLDWDIKFAVIKDALQLLNIRPTDKHQVLSLQKVASRKRLLHLTCKGSRIPCGQEGSLCHNKKKREELGNYIRVYPALDPERTKLYNKLLGSGVGGFGWQTSIRKLQEDDVIELLMQYEDDTMATRLSFMAVPNDMHCSHSPVSPTPHSTDVPTMGMSAAMAMREREEERTQLTMVALNETTPFYPGKTQEEAQIAGSCEGEGEENNAGATGGPVTSRLCGSTNWSKLFLFLLSNSGKGFWVTFVSQSGAWEQAFKAKMEALSMVELACCRRIVQLCHPGHPWILYIHMSSPSPEP
eukprot:Em0011g126a